MFIDLQCKCVFGAQNIHCCVLRVRELKSVLMEHCLRLSRCSDCPGERLYIVFCIVIRFSWKNL